MVEKKISNSYWKKKLAIALEELPPQGTSDTPQRVALLGIGNELNGDDAAGVAVARRLARLLPQRSDLLFVEAGMAPESFSGTLRRFQPQVVIFIDAGDFGGQPGEIELFAGEDSEGFSASTHILPPALLSRFLKDELDCQVWMLAIQLVHVDFDRPMSAAMKTAVRKLTQELVRLL